MAAGVVMDRFGEPAVFYAQVHLCACVRRRWRRRWRRRRRGGGDLLRSNE